MVRLEGSKLSKIRHVFKASLLFWNCAHNLYYCYYEAVTEGKMLPETLKAAAEEIMPRREFMTIANVGVQAMIDHREELKRHS